MIDDARRFLEIFFEKNYPYIRKNEHSKERKKNE